MNLEGDSFGLDGGQDYIPLNQLPFPVQITGSTVIGGTTYYAGEEQMNLPDTATFTQAHLSRTFPLSGVGTVTSPCLVEINNQTVTSGTYVVARLRGGFDSQPIYDFSAGSGGSSSGGGTGTASCFTTATMTFIGPNCTTTAFTYLASSANCPTNSIFPNVTAYAFKTGDEMIPGLVGNLATPVLLNYSTAFTSTDTTVIDIDMSATPPAFNLLEGPPTVYIATIYQFCQPGPQGELVMFFTNVGIVGIEKNYIPPVPQQLCTFNRSAVIIPGHNPGELQVAAQYNINSGVGNAIAWANPSGQLCYLEVTAIRGELGHL